MNLRLSITPDFQYANGSKKCQYGPTPLSFTNSFYLKERNSKIRQNFYAKQALAKLVFTVSKETQAPNLQEQIDRVEKIVNHTPFRLFVVGVTGGIILALLSYFGMPWSIVGFAILGGCIGFCSYSVRNAKEEYRKLLEQFNSKS